MSTRREPPTLWDARMWWFIGGAAFGLLSPVALPMHLGMLALMLTFIFIAWRRDLARAAVRS